MSVDTLPQTPVPRTRGRSVMAIAAGFLLVVIGSTTVDAILHAMNIYPPDGQPMWEPELNALALSYRCAFSLAGGYLTARLAPASPVRHAAILGAIGTAVGTLAVVGTWNMGMGPHWYPIALAASGLPLCTLGGMLLHRR